MAQTEHGKVISVEATGTFKGKDGKTQHKHLVKFEDGKEGIEFTTTPNSEFIPDCEYDFYYDERENRGEIWYKVKVAKKRAPRSSSPGRAPRREEMSPDRELTIARQSGLKAAVELVKERLYPPEQVLGLAEILAEFSIGKFPAIFITPERVGKRITKNEGALKGTKAQKAEEPATAPPPPDPKPEPGNGELPESVNAFDIAPPSEDYTDDLPF